MNRKFYDGLDQALSLLRYGLDNVYYFQLFLIPGNPIKQRDKMINAFHFYTRSVRDIIKTLNLPIGYTPTFDFLWNNKLTSNDIQVFEIKNKEKEILIKPKNNPFLVSQLKYSVAVRKFLYEKYIKTKR